MVKESGADVVEIVASVVVGVGVGIGVDCCGRGVNSELEEECRLLSCRRIRITVTDEIEELCSGTSVFCVARSAVTIA
ncbi:hypothetical protein Tco_0594287 [Tanacetum coccineum]